MNNSSFSTLAISPALIKNLHTLGYTTIRPIQALSIPSILKKKDIIAQAKTGSGKTAAFGIGILERLNFRSRHPQALIMAPTRELVNQIANELRKLARHIPNIKVLTLYGGTPYKAQVHSLTHGANIVVATPGRLGQHINEKSIDLSHIEMLILDEADRMLDMGFIDDITSITATLPKNRQSLLFSATIDDETRKLSNHFQQDPLHVKAKDDKNTTITQEFYLSEPSKKFETLIYALSKHAISQAILFCNTKISAKAIAKTLREKRIDALALHGDLEQYERDDVLTQFSNGSCSILVATDVASRGLDIKALELVINFDLPKDVATYTHRIGRSGRSDLDGLAITLYSEDDDITSYNDLEIAYYTPPYTTHHAFTLEPENVTIVLEGGKKDKLRPGDIVGTLIQGAKLSSDAIGDINIFAKQSYIAIKKADKDRAYSYLKNNPIKKRNFSVWILE